MKILITGCTGMLGSSILLTKTKHDLWGTHYDLTPNYEQSLQMDIANIEDVENIFEKVKPNAVIHTIALTNVDLCEENPDLALKNHVEGTRNLIKMAQKYKSYFVNISTDSVFDGIKGDFREERSS